MYVQRTHRRKRSVVRRTREDIMAKILLKHSASGQLQDVKTRTVEPDRESRRVGKEKKFPVELSVFILRDCDAQKVHRTP